MRAMKEKTGKIERIRKMSDVVTSLPMIVINLWIGWMVGPFGRRTRLVDVVVAC
jgi:hypothetical protein